MKKIAIIGFGFCGRMLFYHLTKNPNPNLKITIFEKDQSSFGPAFSSFSPHYILNVPTIKMSAFGDKPKDFCEFLEKNYPETWQEIGENGFAPRHLYGKYLTQIDKEAFENAKKNGVEFEFVFEEVAKIEDEFVITTKNNKTFQASEIVLATSFKQSELPFNFLSKNFVKKLWNSDSLEFHNKNFGDEKILIIGSGLTAVDVVVGLKKKNFSGKIFVTSRRGNFPKKQKTFLNKNPNFISVDDAKKGVLFLCLKIRNFLRLNPQFDLIQAIDSIREISVKLWQNFDQKNQKIFLRLLPYWNIFRHRAPTSSIEIIEEMMRSNQLEIKSGGVDSIEEKNGKFLVKISDEKIECDYLVNCLGFEFRAEKYPLLKQMLENNLLKKELFLVSSNHKKIHLLGGLNIARDFECTSVPDLRKNVEFIVENLGLDF